MIIGYCDHDLEVGPQFTISLPLSCRSPFEREGVGSGCLVASEPAWSAPPPPRGRCRWQTSDWTSRPWDRHGPRERLACPGHSDTPSSSPWVDHASSLFRPPHSKTICLLGAYFVWLFGDPFGFNERPTQEKIHRDKWMSVDDEGACSE